MTVWSDGMSRLVHGDGPGYLECLQQEERDAVRLVLTDPPYAVLTNDDIRGFRNKNTGREGHIRRYVKWDDIDGDEYATLMGRLLRGAAKMPTSWVHVFCAAERIGDMQTWGILSGLRYHMPWIWCKTNPPPRIRMMTWRSAIEASVLYSVGRPDFYGTKHGNWYTGPFESGHRRWHATQKSKPLLEHIIEATTAPGDLVVDPFAGSGQTIIACRDTGRRCIAVELDERQCEVDVLALDGRLDEARALALRYGIIRTSRSSEPTATAQPEQLPLITDWNAT